MIKSFVVTFAVALSLVGCSNHPARPIVDGYTLQGVVLDTGTRTPVSDVTVLMGGERHDDFRPVTVTDANGEFTVKPFPATAPNNEILRFTKPGYAPIDVLARTASRVEDYRYRLDVRLERQE